MFALFPPFALAVTDTCQQSLRFADDLELLPRAQKPHSCRRAAISSVMEGSRQTRVSRPYKISESSKVCERVTVPIAQEA